MKELIAGNMSHSLHLAREFARRLAAKCASARFQVTLFGSRARGDADDESDLDLFVKVGGDGSEKVREAAHEVAGDLTLEYGILVCPFVADRAFMDARRGYSFLEAVAAEGIPVEW